MSDKSTTYEEPASHPSLKQIRPGAIKPLQIRISALQHREIKIAAAMQGQSMTTFLLECYRFWCRVNQ